MARERPEPIFNAPWPALLAAASILVPTAFLRKGDEPTILSLALVPKDFWAGHWAGVVTMMFVHGGWLHALMNAAFAIAFGAPVARLLGTGGRGGAVFWLFYLACGIVSGLGYAMLHPESVGPGVGASGAGAGPGGAAGRA